MLKLCDDCKKTAKKAPECKFSVMEGKATMLPTSQCGDCGQLMFMVPMSYLDKDARKKLRRRFKREAKNV